MSRAQRARVGKGSGVGTWLDFAPAIAPAMKAIDPITFKYWKWKWLKACHNIKNVERLWSSGYDIGFPSL